MYPKILFASTANFCGKPIIDKTRKTITSKIQTIGSWVLSKHWNNETTFDQLFKWLTVNGFPYVPALTDGWQPQGGFKTDSHFLSSQVAFVDVDHKLSIDDAISHKFYKKYGTAYYTTASHTELQHKFRLVFLLPRPIVDANEFVRVTNYLIDIFGGDKNCVDPSRMYYGSIDCADKEITKNCIDTHKLDRILFTTKKKELRTLKKLEKDTVLHSFHCDDQFKQNFLSVASNTSIGEEPRYHDWFRFGVAMKAGGYDVSDFIAVSDGLCYSGYAEKHDAHAVFATNARNITFGTAIHILCKYNSSAKSLLYTRGCCLKKINKTKEVEVMPLFCGAGKSFEIRNRILGSDYLVAVTGTKLMDEYETHLPNITKISYKESSLCINDQINECLDDGQLFVTHKALMSSITLDTFESLNDRHLIIDEVFNPILTMKVCAVRTLGKDGFITLGCKKIKQFKHHVLKVKDHDYLHSLLREGPDGKESFEVKSRNVLIKRILCDTMETQVWKSDKETNTVLFVSIFKPIVLKHFQSITLCGSLCDESALYHLMNIHFKMKTSTYRGRSDLIDYSRVHVSYLYEQNVTRYFLNTYEVIDKHQTYDPVAFMYKKSKQCLQNCLLVLNKHDYETKTINGVLHNHLKKSGIPVTNLIVPFDCEGLEEYDNHTSMSICASYGYEPTVCKWYDYYFSDFLGTNYDVYVELVCAKFLQFIWRTNARCIDSDAEIRVLLPDKRIFDLICSKLRVSVFDIPRNHTVQVKNLK